MLELVELKTALTELDVWGSRVGGEVVSVGVGGTKDDIDGTGIHSPTFSAQLKLCAH